MNPEGRKTCQWKRSRWKAHVQCLKILTWLRGLNPLANERNIVGCYMLRPFAYPVACCCVPVPTLLGVVASVWTSLPTTPNILGPANFSGLHCLAIPGRDLSTKKTKPKIEKWPESLGVMLDYGTWAIWALQLSEFSFLETSLQWFLLTQFLNCRPFFGVEFLEMLSKPFRTKKEEFFGCILAVQWWCNGPRPWK